MQFHFAADSLFDVKNVEKLIKKSILLNIFL